MRPCVTIVDYGRSNLLSVQRALEACGAEVRFANTPAAVRASGALVLPGVGAFADGMAQLRALGLAEPLCAAARAGTPLLGICLGMQLLFERSFEYGEHRGLGLLKGDVVAMEGRLPAELKIPHMGWNSLHKVKPSRILANTREGEFVYFVHSYFASGCGDSLAATTDYGQDLTAAVENGCVCGCQFHPEKSGPAGLDILRAFCAMEG